MAYLIQVSKAHEIFRYCERIEQEQFFPAKQFVRFNTRIS